MTGGRLLCSGSIKWWKAFDHCLPLQVMHSSRDLKYVYIVFILVVLLVFSFPVLALYITLQPEKTWNTNCIGLQYDKHLLWSVVYEAGCKRWGGNVTTSCLVAIRLCTISLKGRGEILNDKPNGEVCSFVSFFPIWQTSHVLLAESGLVAAT